MQFLMRYAPSSLGKFVETPLPEWNEQIFMIEHHSRNWWEFSANMYRHNPLSATLEVWAQRYIVAYETAAGQGSTSKGSSRLLDANRAAVPAGWRQDFAVGDGSAVIRAFTPSTVGMPKVAPPALVSNPRPALFAQGECW